MDLENDIARSLIEAGNIYQYYDEYSLNRFTKIYPYTTENINGYFSQFNLASKKILTVGSSADQIINAISMNCYDITCFDINPYVKYYFELKKAAIMALDYNDFFNFFSFLDYPKTFRNNKKAFSYYTYRKISPYIEKNSKCFWDNLYLELDGLDIRKNLFSNDEEKVEVLKLINRYLNEKEYYLIKNKILNAHPNFINSDIVNVESKLKEKYDYIFLSNIAGYLEIMFQDNLLENFRNLVLNLSKFINENGVIIMAYLYNTNDKSKYDIDMAIIYNLEKVKKVFCNDNIKMTCFKGVNDLLRNVNTTDAVLVYKK